LALSIVDKNLIRLELVIVCEALKIQEKRRVFFFHSLLRAMHPEEIRWEGGRARENKSYRLPYMPPSYM
jgi:hypothetical protein